MNIGILLRFVHIISAMGMVTGVVGRQMARAQALQAKELVNFLALSNLAGRFEARLVRPGSSAILISGVAAALVQGWPMFGFLQGSPINWLLVSIVLIVGVFLVIALVFIPRGKMYEKYLQEAIHRGEITPELRASLADPIVAWGHRYEEAAILVILFLMVTKPF